MNNTVNDKSKQKTRNVEIKNRQGFTQVSNDMLSDPNISYKSKGILCQLIHYQQNNIDITLDLIINESTDGKLSISSAIDELKKYGYLEIIQIPGQKGKWSYIIKGLL